MYARCGITTPTLVCLEHYEHYCAHMHCDVDLRSRRMWAASYRLTRLIMNEDFHVPSGLRTRAHDGAHRCDLGGCGGLACLGSVDSASHRNE